MFSLDRSILEIIERDFSDLYSGELGLSSIKGGETVTDEALATLDMTGYANKRSEFLPKSRRDASVLSPYIRHNLLILPEVHHAVKRRLTKLAKNSWTNCICRNMPAIFMPASAPDFLKIAI